MHLVFYKQTHAQTTIQSKDTHLYTSFVIIIIIIIRIIRIIIQYLYMLGLWILSVHKCTDHGGFRIHKSFQGRQ